MNTIKDILKDNLTQMGLIENLSLPHIFLVLGTALFCGILIYCVYKFFYRGAVYSESFGLLIVMSAMTVAFIIMTISSNIVLSLGMVGALSIVRFRAAVKDPLDVGFLFLAIGAGLTAGAGLLLIAVIGTAAICMVFIAMFALDKRSMSYLLVVRCGHAAEGQVVGKLKGIRHQLKTKSGDGNTLELTYTLKMKEDSILEEILSIEGVDNALLVSYTGDAQY
ncbi:MAG: DUF4956 domain-containing protein [Lachnoclostridium sp.]|nr:DUF4956 domain-containing protein [Lachnospira sp.]MCM1248507.1 DUF4956 domain-containing protein [Lachnoclostridium sp.]MCM1535331.1 DUF4956 domain-containing protein [Clostridium sp.]